MESDEQEAKGEQGEVLSGDRFRSGRSDRGFTLVELLVVVVIMGVLATVSVLGVRGLTDRGQVSACQSDRRVLEVAIETWFADESASTSGTLSEAALVTAQLLRGVSTLHDVAASGAVTATSGGACS